MADPYDSIEAASPTSKSYAQLFRLNLDVATRDVVEGLGQEGIPSILLRGPAIAQWLYDDGWRAYTDIDLLIPADRQAAAGHAVAALGFTLLSAMSSAHDRPQYDTKWHRPLDGAQLELHTSLSGIGAAHQRVWEILSADPESIPLGVEDFRVEILRVPARALMLGLHAGHHGPTLYSPRVDLEKALDRLPPYVWDEALELARRLDAVATFTSGLRLSPAGAALAESIGLTERSVEAELMSTGAPAMSLMLDWLMQLPGLKAKAIFVIRELCPPPQLMRTRSELARRGALGLLAAYARRPFSLLRRLGPAVIAWRRAVRGVR
jgi:hypothetical protein